MQQPASFRDRRSLAVPDRYLKAEWLSRTDIADRAMDAEMRMENILVGKSDDEAITRGVVLALVLSYKTTAGLVVGLPLTTTTPFGLVAPAIGLVLGKFDSSHCC